MPCILCALRRALWKEHEVQNTHGEGCSAGSPEAWHCAEAAGSVWAAAGRDAVLHQPYAWVQGRDVTAAMLCGYSTEGLVVQPC